MYARSYLELQPRVKVAHYRTLCISVGARWESTPELAQVLEL